MRKNILIVLASLFFSIGLFGLVQAEEPSDGQSLLQTIREQMETLQKRIAELQKELESLVGQAKELESEIKFTQTLAQGVKNDEVKQLQELLAKDPEIYPEGKITGFFGFLTQQAVKRFQEKYAEDILSPVGLKIATGIVGSSTRAKLNELYGNISSTKSTAPSRPFLNITSPNGGEEWVRGQTYDITWKSGSYGKVNISLNLSRRTGQTTNVESWSIANNVVTSLDGRYSWRIPSSQATNTSYYIYIVDADGTMSEADDSGGKFSILERISEKITVISTTTSATTSTPLQSTTATSSATTTVTTTSIASSTISSATTTEATSSSAIVATTTSQTATTSQTQQAQTETQTQQTSSSQTTQTVTTSTTTTASTTSSTTTDTTDATTTATCSETDGGQNYSLKGNTKVTGSYIGLSEANDWCSGSVLYEYYCSSDQNNLIKSISYTCSDGCQNGVCISVAAAATSTEETTSTTTSSTTSTTTTATTSSSTLTCSDVSDGACPSGCSAGSDADCCTNGGKYWLRASWGYGCYNTSYNSGCSAGQSCSVSIDGCCPNWCSAGSDADCAATTTGSIDMQNEFASLVQAFSKITEEIKKIFGK